MHRRRAAMHYQVVVNMCSNVAQAREVFHRFAAAVEKYIGVRPNFLGHLLRDESLRVAVTLQSPVALFPETDPSSRSFMRLSDALKQAVDGHHPSSGFTGFWQRQFRQRQLADNAERKAQPAVDGDDQHANQRDGLAELKLHLLRQMESPDAPQAELAATLAVLNRSYLKRFGESIVEPLTLIDALIAMPERNDHLLRDLAARLKPWRGDLQNLEALPSAASFESERTGDKSELAAQPIVIVDDTVADNTVVADDSSADNVVIAVSPTARILSPHRYDERRFGSQQALLELLQRQRESGKSAMALIEVILT
jgi:hypothetical protein